MITLRILGNGEKSLVMVKIGNGFILSYNIPQSGLQMTITFENIPFYTKQTFFRFISDLAKLEFFSFLSFI
jgi:hypothetical protein